MKHTENRRNVPELDGFVLRPGEDDVVDGKDREHTVCMSCESGGACM
jgi:hypothetical protein